jgi:hypothetical protein
VWLTCVFCPRRHPYTYTYICLCRFPYYLLLCTDLTCPVLICLALPCTALHCTVREPTEMDGGLHALEARTAAAREKSGLMAPSSSGGVRQQSKPRPKPKPRPSPSRGAAAASAGAGAGKGKSYAQQQEDQLRANLEKGTPTAASLLLVWARRLFACAAVPSYALLCSLPTLLSPCCGLADFHCAALLDCTCTHGRHRRSPKGCSGAW